MIWEQSMKISSTATLAWNFLLHPKACNTEPAKQNLWLNMRAVRRKFNFWLTMKKESKTKCIQKFHSLPKQIDEDHLKYHYNFAYLFVDHAVMGRIHKNCSWVFVPLCALVRILHVVVWALHILESITNKKLTRQKIMTRLDQGKSCDTALNALSNELKRKP